MALGFHNIKPAKGAKTARKRVGRGLGSTGTYSGRGGKGQTARSGVSGLRRLGLKRTILAQPKLRGFKSLETKSAVVNLAALAKHFDGKKIVSVASLKEAGLIPASARKVKVLAVGELTAAYTVKGCAVSASAKEKIEKAGGKIL